MQRKKTQMPLIFQETGKALVSAEDRGDNVRVTVGCMHRHESAWFEIEEGKARDLHKWLDEWLSRKDSHDTA